jgi:TPR repeat protein
MNLLPSVALADPIAPAVLAAPAASATPSDPKKLMEQAEKALDIDGVSAAIKIYLQAAELNYTPAQVQMGEFADFAQFYEEAVGWYLMAATQGDAAGQFNLGKMYSLGNGIEKDEAKAAYWIRRSAAKDYTPAVKYIVQAYQVGLLGFKVDQDLARSWGAKAKRLEAIEKKAAAKRLEDLAAAKKKLREDAAKKADKNK